MSNSSGSFSVPAHLSVGDRSYLEEHAKLINNILEGSYLTIGQILLKVQEYFKSDDQLNGWFYKWIENNTHLGPETARQLINIAKQASDDPKFAELTKKIARSLMNEVANLPKSYRDKVQETLDQYPDQVSRSSLQAFSKHPFVQHDKIEELVNDLQLELVSLKLDSMTADERKQHTINSQVSRTNDRLRRAITELTSVKEDCKTLREQQVTSEALIATLHKQLRSSTLQIKEIVKDPDSVKKRELAKVQVELTQALDGMLATLDRYDVSRDDISELSAKRIQEKLDLVYAKLRRTCTAG